MRTTTKPTIAKCIATVARQCKNSKLTDKTWENVHRETVYLKRKLHLSPMQCYFVAVLMRKPCEGFSTAELAEYAGVDPVEVLAYQDDLDNLIERHIVDLYKDCDGMEWQQYLAASEVMVRAVRQNKMPDEKDCHIGVDGFWNRIAVYLKECENKNISYQYMQDSIWRVTNHFASHLSCASELTSLSLNRQELMLLMIACSKLINDREDEVSSYDYGYILPPSIYREIIAQFKEGTSALLKNDVLSPTDDDCDTFSLTNHARELLLGKGYVTDTIHQDENQEKTASETQARNDNPGITEKKMFYNKEEKEQVERLMDILSQKKFSDVQSRMKEANMRTGFCCILHGEPGTGKTETVLQIAHKTERKVIQVDIASIRSMWVGESEQNIKRVFDDYKKELTEGGNMPILFFNEADAVFGKRLSGVNTEVDEMANRIQNIILQEMETFEGILIATTNLTDNFDSAFERRFLYKIEFHKPQLMTRKAIWESMVPDLSSDDAMTLAKRYGFTGGDIENVARKILIDKVLYGKLLSLEEILTMCDSEKLHKKLSIEKLTA